MHASQHVWLDVFLAVLKISAPMAPSIAESDQAQATRAAGMANCAVTAFEERFPNVKSDPRA